MLEVKPTETDSKQNTAGPRHAPASDECLPPVQPPSAAFLIQLFVVPALIVLVIVGVWLTFTWLVRRTSPETMIQGLEHGPSVARWQRASELADMLRNKRYAQFKRDPQAAANVARILNREIDQATDDSGMQEEEITLRYFLARALGEFEVQEGTGALLKAAQSERAPSEQLVRHGALEALAVRAHNLAQFDPPQTLEHPDLAAALDRLSADEDPLIRSETAYALGQIGTPAAIDRLEIMVDDPHADTRYNAAVGLARRGNAKAVETLAEMLDLKELARTQAGNNERSEATRRAVIVSNALQGIEALAQKNSDVDLSSVIEALTQLAEADAQELKNVQVPPRAASEAQRVLNLLQTTSAERASK